MEGRQLLQYLIDTSDVLLAKKQEATEYLAQLERRPTKRALDENPAGASFIQKLLAAFRQ